MYKERWRHPEETRKSTTASFPPVSRSISPLSRTCQPVGLRFWKTGHPSPLRLGGRGPRTRVLLCTPLSRHRLRDTHRQQCAGMHTYLVNMSISDRYFIGLGHHEAKNLTAADGGGRERWTCPGGEGLSGTIPRPRIYRSRLDNFEIGHGVLPTPPVCRIGRRFVFCALFSNFDNETSTYLRR